MLTNMLSLSSLQKDKQIYQDDRASFFIDTFNDRCIPYKLFIFSIKPAKNVACDEYDYLTELLKQIKSKQIQLDLEHLTSMNQSCCIIHSNPAFCKGDKVATALKEFWPNYVHIQHLFLDINKVQTKYKEQAQNFFNDSKYFVQLEELDEVYSDYMQAFPDVELYLNLTKEGLAHHIKQKEVFAVRDTDGKLAGACVCYPQKDYLYVDYGFKCSASNKVNFVASEFIKREIMCAIALGLKGCSAHHVKGNLVGRMYQSFGYEYDAAYDYYLFRPNSKS